VWFIRFCIPPKDLGDPGSSRGTLERVRVDLILYRLHDKKIIKIQDIKISHLGTFKDESLMSCRERDFEV
jgi:hypothetical protein